MALTLITSASLMDIKSLPEVDCSFNRCNANVVTMTEAAKPETAPERTALGTSGLSSPLRKMTTKEAMTATIDPTTAPSQSASLTPRSAIFAGRSYRSRVQGWEEI